CRVQRCIVAASTSSPGAWRNSPPPTARTCHPAAAALPTHSAPSSSAAAVRGHARTSALPLLRPHVEHQRMLLDHVAVAIGDLVLQAFDFLAGELDHLA